MNWRKRPCNAGKGSSTQLKSDSPKRPGGRWLVDTCHAERITDLARPAVLGAIGTLRNSGVSLRTCNAYTVKK